MVYYLLKRRIKLVNIMLLKDKKLLLCFDMV